nr:hypothetical protein [Methylomarinum sp. Ch1-1]MDP4518948.1 hypothetical protein [Methylomarinum sp. Ch1-1]MDP4523348.1 hypothetical protein [Methylomarinum sp. Ch1-1]
MFFGETIQSCAIPPGPKEPGFSLDFDEAVSDEFMEKALDEIKKWDVRQSKKLIEALPEIIPKKYQGGQIECEIGEDDDWVLYLTAPGEELEPEQGLGMG